MPRASRYFLPGYVWHITHRCHQRKFLFKFAPDRRRYLYWLFEAKKRYGLCVLDYMVTSNQIHLLIKDTGPSIIADGMQLIAGTHGALGGGTAPIICNAKADIRLHARHVLRHNLVKTFGENPNLALLTGLN